MMDVSTLDQQATRRPDLPSLTSLRAFAALAVFLFHVRLWEQIGEIAPTIYGYAGVGFFFILSGFILTWSSLPTQTKRAFYLRRFARVYPSHFACWVLLITAAALSLTTGYDTDPAHATVNLLLVQAWHPDTAYSVNTVAWSLSAEAFFYALFPFLLPKLARLRLRLLWAVTVAALLVSYAAVIGITAWLHTGPLVIAAFTNPLMRLPEFILGIAGARTLIMGRRVSLWAFAPAAAFAMSGLTFMSTWPSANVWLTPLSAVLIYWSAQRDLDKRPRWLASPFLLTTGRISFAFYLVHVTAIRAAQLYLGNGLPAAMVALLISGVAAVLIHYWLEVPLNRLILKVVGGRQRSDRFRRSKLLPLRVRRKSRRTSSSHRP